MSAPPGAEEKRRLLAQLLQRKAARATRFPLSFAQQRLWFLHRFDPASPLYDMPVAYRLHGPLDAGALQGALGEIVRRHEALRTVFTAEDGEAVQVVAPPGAWRLQADDLSALDAVEREAEVRRRAREDALRPFDLEAGPLFRAALLRCGPEEHVLLLCVHHAVSDGWSMEVLVRELDALYEAFAAGLPSPLPEPPLQYADWALWQRERLGGPPLERLVEFWRERLAGAPATLELPTDRPRPATQSFRGSSVPFALDAGATHGLRALARDTESTLFTVLLAGFQLLLARYAGTEDVVVGTPVAGRTRRETEEVVGLFVNTLALRTRLDGDPTFAELVARVREMLLGAHDHQELPFERLVGELRVERSLSHAPVFQVMFSLQGLPRPFRLGGVRAIPLEAVCETAKFDLSLMLQEEGGAVAGYLEYATDLFDRSTAERMLEHLGVLLAAAADDPALPLSRVPLLAPAERRRLLEEWNRTGRAYPPAAAHELFAAQAARTPDAVAVQCGGERLTYAELHRRAGRLAEALRSRGVGPESRVGICMERSAEMVVAVLGTLRAGAAYVPLDPSHPAERIAWVLEDAGVRVVLAQSRVLGHLPELGAEVVLLDGADPDVAPDGNALPHSRTPALSHSQSLAYVIYTSGSTGRPKGVAVTHGGLGNYLQWAAEAYGLDGGEGAPVHSSLGFDLTVTSLLLPLVAGRRVVMVPDSLGVEALADVMRTERDFTLVKLTPRHLALLGEQLAPDEAAGRTRTFVVGGESLAPEDMAFWRRYAPDTVIVNEYGPTETVVGCCVRRVAAGEPLSGAVPIGRPIANTRLYVLDRGLEPLPTGVAGELCVGGAGVSRGYLGRAGLTADRFVPDPFGGEPGARMYRTGDRARWLAAGELEFLGRADFQLKVRGFRIEPGEIEAALLEQEGIREAVVTARGEGAGRRLVAHVAGEGAADAARLREALRARLPEYMVPAAFVALETLPLTPNGKVDRAALPDPERGAAADGWAPPRDETEAALCRLWGEVLGVERVGVRDNFFELGGDSIVSIRVLARARVLGLECTLPDLFRHQTVEALAAHLRGGGARGERRPEVPPFGLLAAADRARLPAGLVDAFPATALQLGMIYHGEQDPSSTLYHDLTGLRVRGPFDAEALGRAVAAAMRRHAVLRSRFELSRFGEPLQLVHAELPAPLAVHDLGALPAEEREAATDAVWEAEKGRRFDPARAPLFRVHAYRLGPDEFRLLLVHHHAILDGWSVATLLRELLDGYAAELGGTPSDDAPPRAEFREFVALEREAAASGEQREFWTERLRDRPDARLAAPAGERGVWEGERIGVREAALPAALAEGAARLAREAGTPLKSVLLAAHLRVVALLGGGAEALTGLVSNGRPEGSDGERVLGLFLNTLPFGAALRGGSWLELVRETFAAEREVLPFRRFPLAEMQRLLGGEALFDTAFNFVSFHVLDGARATGPLRVLETRGHGSNSVPCMTIFSASPGRLEMAVQYDRALVPDALAARVWEWHRAALEAMTGDPLSRYEAGDLLAPAERARVLEAWNAPDRAYPADACVHDLFAAQAARTPDAVAVSWRGEPTTYAGLDRRSARLANALRRRGVGPESRVGVCLPRTPELVVALLAVLRAGGAYVPLDPAYPRERLGWMLEDAGIGLVLTGSDLADRLPAGAADLLLLDREDLSAESDVAPESGAGPENLSHVIFTSGSTGRPKGVMIRHSSTTVLLHWLRETVSDAERSSVLFSTSINFDVSVAEIFGTLCWGGKLVLVENALDLAGLAEPVVYASMVPSAAAELLRSGGIPASVRTLNLGGEALPAPLAQGLYALGTVERVGNLYGPTEDTTYSTYSLVDPGAERVSIGRPVANTRAYVLDAHLEPSPVGIAGELYLAGAGLARGYAGRPDLTAERWLPDPFGGQGARMYRVMDRVRWTPAGELEYLGRTDHQVKVRGFRIELGEIEAALLAQDGVREAVAVVRGDDAGDRRLVAYVVAGPEVDAAGLRARLRERLPEHMVPPAVVALERLPLTPNGKTDRRALPDPEWRGAAAAHVAPRDGVEAALCALWGETLGAERVGALDDFFEAGGHSLAAVRLVARVNEAFGAALPVSALLHARTVRGMAEALRDGGAGTAASPLVPIRPGGSRPPLFCVHAAAGTVLPYLPLADALGPDQPFYGLEAPPLAGGETTLEEMAEEYVRAVRAARPAGPYRLGGWSVGGVIAFEMARRLHAAGEEVELLALLDSYPPLDGMYGTEPGDVELLAFLARDLGYPRAELPALEERLAGEAPAERADRLAAALAERVPAAAGPGAAELRERAAAYGRILRAAAGYRPAAYAGRVTLLLAAEGPGGPGDPRLGWSRLTPLPLDARTAPGDHHGMLAGANALALAALLDPFLRPQRHEPAPTLRAPAPTETIESTR